MKFKRNLTVTFVCFINELYISLIPVLFIIGLCWELATVIELCKITIFVIPIIIIINISIYLVSLLFNIFQKKTFTLSDEKIIIENDGELLTIYYKDITDIYFDLGEMISRTHSTSVKLELYCRENNRSITVINPSLIMTHLIKKKCSTARIIHYNTKRVLKMLGISTITAIVIVVCEYFGVSLI